MTLCELDLIIYTYIIISTVPITYVIIGIILAVVILAVIVFIIISVLLYKRYKGQINFCKLFNKRMIFKSLDNLALLRLTITVTKIL